MAPRQRLVQPSISIEGVAALASTQQGEHRPLLADDNSSSSSLTSSSSSSSAAKEVPSSGSLPADQQEATEFARRQHDYFNLIALMFVISATAVNYDIGTLLREFSLLRAWNGNHFHLMWLTTFFYFIIDLVWVAVVRVCVKSPNVIIKHHVVAVLYLFGPYIFSKYRWMMGAILSVEINTWFLILRRILYKSGDQVSSSRFAKAVSMCFYVSWIIIRCFVYPALLIEFLRLAYQAVIESNQWFHWPMIYIPAHFFLCVLNFKWTYDLFLPMIKKWKTPGSPDAAAAEGPAVASGL